MHIKDLTFIHDETDIPPVPSEPFAPSNVETTADDVSTSISLTGGTTTTTIAPMTTSTIQTTPGDAVTSETQDGGTSTPSGKHVHPPMDAT